MFDIFSKANAARNRLVQSEAAAADLAQKLNKAATERDQAVNRAVVAEKRASEAEADLATRRQWLKDVNEALEAGDVAGSELAGLARDAREASKKLDGEVIARAALQEALDELEAKLNAKEDELKALSDVHTKAERAETDLAAANALLKEIAAAAACPPTEPLAAFVQKQREALEQVHKVLDEMGKVLDDVGPELRDAAVAPSAAEDAEAQPPAESVSIGEPAAAAPLVLDEQAFLADTSSASAHDHRFEAEELRA